MTRNPPPTAPSPQLSIDEALQRAYGHWNAGQADQAELFCQRVLAAWPGQPDALHLMGIMAHAYGNLDLAIHHLRQACLAPRAPALYYSNLAEMCRQKGLLEEGEQAARRALALNPDLVAAWGNLGIILQEAGKLEESVTFLEGVAARQPGSAEAHNNLGNTLKRLGRLDLAEQHYATALSLSPNYAEAHSNLSNLLNARGLCDRAADEARLAIDLNPRLADAYLNLAAIESGRHGHAEALRWLNALLAFAPGHAGALAAQALALRHLHRLDDALVAARNAVAAAPASADAHNALGQVYQALDRFDEATECFVRAAALPGTSREVALLGRANLLAELGEKEQALAAYAEILESYPRSAAAWAGQATHRKFQPGDPGIARMEALLQPSGVQSFAERMQLHFALGKACLDAGEDDRAFHHLGEGNRMRRSGITFDIAASVRWMEGIAEVFSSALLNRFDGVGAESHLPVFILGMPRSGTTLIEQILASHPQVHGAGELSLMSALATSLGEYPAAVGRLGGEDFARIGREYLAGVEPLAGGRRHVIDKMPSNFLHAGLIRLALPNARIIHCRRDPVDTCLSCYTQLFSSEQSFAYDLAELGHFHGAYQDLMTHWRARLPGNRFIEVDYERVVDDLEGQARRLLDFLELPWDDACLRFYETRRAVRTASLGQVRQPIYKSSAGRWKRYARHLGPLLDALGVRVDDGR